MNSPSFERRFGNFASFSKPNSNRPIPIRRLQNPHHLKLLLYCYCCYLHHHLSKISSHLPPVVVFASLLLLLPCFRTSIASLLKSLFPRTISLSCRPAWCTLSDPNHRILASRVQSARTTSPMPRICDEESQTPPMASPDSRPSRRPATN